MKYIIFQGKHIFTLANVFSLLAIVFWFTGILFILENEYRIAFNIILVWVIFDILDGYTARKSGSVSDFGKILDLVSDIFLYVLSVVFLYIFTQTHDIFWYLLLLGFLIISILRLVYFSTFGFYDIKNNSYYLGMPVYFHLIFFQVLLYLTNRVGIYAIFSIIILLMILKIPFRKYGLEVSIAYVVILFIINNITFLW